MTIGLKLDETTHDFILTDGRLEVVSNEDKTAQDLKTRLKTLKGEFILDISYGFDYNKLLESRVVNLSEIESSIKRYILETPNVKNITKFLLKYEKGSTRKLSVSFSVQTISGEIVSTGVSL